MWTLLLGGCTLVALAVLGFLPEAFAQGRALSIKLGKPMSVTASIWGFRLMAAVAGGFALLMISRREVVSAVVCLVGSFFGLAGCYVFLTAHFLAALQILIYAGAVMVLFLFVIMLLNRPEPDLGMTRHLGTRIIGGAAALIIVYRVGTLLQARSPKILPTVGQDFGTVSSVGKLLFSGEFLIAFEITSILLLTAVVGAVVVAHRTRRREQELRDQMARREQAAVHERSHPRP
jgi:NADH-quinone oxidoreductase subunit J